MGAKPTRLTPRSTPATTSPRLTRTHIFMRKAPLFPFEAAPPAFQAGRSISPSALHQHQVNVVFSPFGLVLPFPSRAAPVLSQALIQPQVLVVSPVPLARSGKH